MTNAATIQTIYEAFGRGDIPAIVEHLSPDVEWERWDEGNSAQQAGIPTMAFRKGHEGAIEFFGSLGALEITRFNVRAIFEAGDTVIGRVDICSKVIASGVEIEDDEYHVFTFGADGKIVAFRHVLDTGKWLAAFGK